MFSSVIWRAGRHSLGQAVLRRRRRFRKIPNCATTEAVMPEITTFALGPASTGSTSEAMPDLRAGAAVNNSMGGRNGFQSAGLSPAARDNKQRTAIRHGEVGFWAFAW